MQIKRMLQQLVLVSCVCFSVAYANQISSESTATQNTNKIELFYIQTANHAVLSNHKLTLLTVYPKTLWFADAPSSLAGSMTNAAYIQQLWGKPSSAFNVTNPNGALSGYIIKSKTHAYKRVNIIMTLSHAIYHAHANSMQYEITKVLYAHTLKPITTNLIIYQPTLFIDVYIPPGEYPPINQSAASIAPGGYIG